MSPTESSLEALRDVGSESDGSLGSSEVSDVLQSEHKRLLLYVLSELRGTQSLADVATILGSWKADEDDPPDELQEEIRIELHHDVIPDLVFREYVAYDRSTNGVTLTETGEQLAPYLEKARDLEDEATFLDQPRVRQRR